MTTPILKWRDGAGWLILSGSPDIHTDTRAQVLARIKAGGGIAYVGMRVEDIESLMDDMDDLGAPTGYFVNIVTEDDASIEARLTEASCIVLPNIAPLEDFHSALMGAALQGIIACYELGGVIFAEGATATLFGTMFFDSTGKPHTAFNWLEGVVIFSDITSMAEAPMARQLLASGEAGLALGIGKGSAIAFGTEAQLTPLGKQQVTLVLGSAPPL
jgi:hypothetical protein